MQTILKEALTKIKPTKAEQLRFKKAAEEFLKKLNAKLKDAHAILGGSGAKGTWLSGNHDIDIFVLFPLQKYRKESLRLSDLLESSLKKVFPKQKIERLHGSRDYFQLQYQNCAFEVMPILKIGKAAQAVNITDVSPLHTKWVNAQAKKIKDDILLAKQFCRAQRLYGAESYITGFSGYVLEILTAASGSFEKLLQAAQRWEMKDVIDVAHHYPKKNVFFELNQSKLRSPLVVIDPVDPKRNAAAALSLEKFLQFKKVARAFLRQPTVSFFTREALSLQHLKKRAEKEKTNLVFLSVAPLRGKEDVVGMKLVKVYDFLKKRLSPFSLQESGWDWDAGEEARFYFFLKKKMLPAAEERKGPPLELKESVAAFRKKYPKTFVRDGKIRATVAFPHPDINSFVAETLKDSYVQERLQRIKSVTIL
ncbi:MAG: CCA tRNA nucleotidyltransferase [Nanoarchaeota archaeon]|nr:CCA tRNA nucleotidyltransferase [Nanoarchaeota archaeon]